MLSATGPLISRRISNDSDRHSDGALAGPGAPGTAGT
jgi:hypothetical protein